MRGNIYTVRSGWYTLSVSAAIIFIVLFSNTLTAQTCKGFRTQTQSDWGEQPRKNNPAAYLYANFAAAFPNGLTLGCNNKLVLTTPQSITNLLPVYGKLAKLSAGTTTNPTARKFANPFAGQVVALKLNVTFDAFDVNFGTNTILLKDLVINRGAFAKMTVAEVLDEAEKALGGCSTTHTLYQLNEIVTRINRSYMDGSTTGNYLSCPESKVVTCANDTQAPVISGCPTADINIISPYECFPFSWEEPTATDNCTNPPTITSTMYSGSCVPVGSNVITYTATDSSGNKSYCTFKINVAYDPSILAEAWGLKGKLDLDVQAEPRSAKVAFVSETATQVDYFIVEKKDANGDFVEVAALNGNAEPGLQFHTIIDDNPNDGDNTYRVTSVLIDGTTLNSVTKSVRLQGLSQTKIYPNPASDFVTVDLTTVDAKSVNLFLYNSIGYLLKTYTVEEPSEPYTMDVSGLKNGTYMLRIATPSKREITKQITITRD